MNIISPSSLIVGKQKLNLQLAEMGAWHVQSLPLQAYIGKHEFVTCHICKDISCTISNCVFDNDFSSSIKYAAPTVLLIFGLSGYTNFKLTSANLKCTVRPGDVWLINVNDDELLRNTSAKVHTKMLVVKYSMERINAAFKDSDEFKLALSRNQILRLGHMVSVNHWVSRLINNPMSSVTDRLLAEARALELIARWITPNNIDPDEIAGNSENPNREQLNNIINLLVRDLSNPPSLEELALHAGMSHTRLNRQFKKAFGTTVFDWLRSYRLERAMSYLKDDQRSITQIAFQCGFSSASHFAQLFKRRYGCSPIEFRHN
ncbi:MAG: AraC family transcriptional regulator [Marinagarivorans sp.]|nr:AraC family transcriptional regulator [Marinagarivorans sp.]